MRYFPWMEICALLAVIQVAWAGYTLGAGNQAIQIAFLKHLADPSLYAGDPLLGTMARYPTYGPRILSWFVTPATLPPIYFALHALTTFAVLAGCVLLGHAMFRSRAAGLVAALLLLGGHHRALASTALYWQNFTHTWAALALAVLALALFFRSRHLAAFLLAGILFNLHALTAVYLAAMLGLAVLWEWKSLGARRIGLCFGLLTIAALPAVPALAASVGGFDDTWLRLVRVRSSPHSFPLSWWQPGHPELPLFAAVAALAAVSAGFAAPPETRRRTLLLAAGAAVLFLAGLVGAEFLPHPAVIRAQLFRSSSLLLLVFLLWISHGIVSAWRAPVHPISRDVPLPVECAPPCRPGVPTGRFPLWIQPALALEALCAAAIFLAVALPPLSGLLPAVLLCAALTALATGRLSVTQAAAAGGGLLVCAVAWRQGVIATPSLDLPPGGFSLPAAWLRWEPATAAAAILCLIVSAAFLRPRPLVSVPLRVGVLALAALLLASHYQRSVLPAETADPWVETQRWARDHTPRNAVFLTPALPGGFRVHAERAVAGEWRDGTQQYFDPDFGLFWWDRMQALLPGLLYDESGRRLLAKGQSLADLNEDAIASLARRFGAAYIVLPRSARRGFVKCHGNDAWTVYRNERIPPPPPAPPPTGVHSAEIWKQQEDFLKTTVRPNIEKNRKSDVQIRLVDSDGRPLGGIPFEIAQTDSLFLFGSALGFFLRPPGGSNWFERSAYDVVPKELELFPEIFNFSIVGYSGKWAVMEPRRGECSYADLDAYMDWCRDHKVRVQFHFLTGYEPRWLRALPAAEQQEALLARSRDLQERYGTRMESWQVVNEKHLLNLSPAVFEAMKKTDPNVRLGISDCVVFWSDRPPGDREKEMSRGMLENIRWLKSKGVPVDFAGIHGHRPFPLWADVRDIYSLFDAFAKEGVRIYVTEFGLESSSAMCGPVRSGRWNDDLQAEYYELIFTVCFSHPAVDGINFWGLGPRTFIPGAGLLDRDYKPKPAFHRLRKLIRETWRTSLNGRTGLDSRIAFRGFHGEYRMVLRPASGPAAETSFVVGPAAADFVATLDRATGGLTLAPAPRR